MNALLVATSILAVIRARWHDSCVSVGQYTDWWTSGIYCRM